MSKKQRFLIACIGETGTGKSSIAKQFLKLHQGALVFDIQEEYELPDLKDIINHKAGNQLKKSMSPSFGWDLENFTLAVEKSTDHLIICEESTGWLDTDFFRSKIGKRFISCVLSKRHTGNNFVVIFHSFNSIPPKLWGYIDFMFVFPNSERDKPDFVVPILEQVQGAKYEKLGYPISDFRVVTRSSLGRDNTDFLGIFKEKMYELPRTI